MPTGTPTPKPTRLYRKTYLQLLNNSVGSQLFRNFYIRLPDGTETDALADGSNSCAFFVSSVLALFKKLEGPHGMVASTLHDLQYSGWQSVSTEALEPGDVLVWEAQQFADGTFAHIGFYLGNGQAVSTSWTKKCVVQHSATFDTTRSITHAFRHDGWDVTEAPTGTTAGDR